MGEGVGMGFRDVSSNRPNPSKGFEIIRCQNEVFKRVYTQVQKWHMDGRSVNNGICDQIVHT